MRLRLNNLLAAVPLAGALAMTGCVVNEGGSQAASTTTTTSTTANPTTPASFLISGTVHGGLAPVSGAHVYLLAVGTSGYGGSSVSVLNGSITQLSDSTGGYVTTNNVGVFYIPSTALTCTSSQMTYLLATGGSAGSGANSANSMMAALGPCPTAAPAANVWVNEVTTIGTVYALAGFATDALHLSSSGTAAATLGVRNAFSVVPNLYNPVTGAALATTPNGNGQVPQQTINLLANILASCINSGSSSSAECRSLFGAASAVVRVTDTASAAIYLAHAPATNVATLYELQTLGGVTFQPSLAAAPVSLILPILYTGGILANSLGLSVDANGTVWVGSGASGRRNGFSTAGVPLSSAGFADDLTGTEYAVAVDPAGDTWAIDENSSLLSELSESGQVIGATSLFTAAQLDQPFAVSFDHFGLIWVADDNGVTQLLPGGGVTMKVAIPSFSGDGIADVEVDGLGNIWGTNFDNNTIVKLLPSGVPAFGLAGVGGGGLFSPQGIAFDANNDVWVGNANGTSVSKFANSGYPLSPTGFFGGGVAGSRYVAVDGDGHVWTPSSSDGVIGEFDNSGNPICATGFPIVPGGTGFWGVAIDGSGNVWSTSLNGGLVQLVGAAAPVITPLSVASKNNMLGTRP